MKYFFLTLSLFIASCSTNRMAKVAPDEYLKLNQLHASKHKVCLQQIDKLLVRAVTETDEAELDDENYFFVREEKNALSFLTNFDLSKFTLKENLLEHSALINSCSQKIAKEYKACDTLMPAYKYFRGIIYGLRQYQWSPSTRQIAVAQTLKYIEYVAISEASLMEILLANDLLMRLATLGVVKESLYQETVEFRHEGEAVHKNLRKKLRKLSKKKLKCDDAQDFYANEREEVIELSQKFLILVRKA